PRKRRKLPPLSTLRRRPPPAPALLPPARFPFRGIRPPASSSVSAPASAPVPPSSPPRSLRRHRLRPVQRVHTRQPRNIFFQKIRQSLGRTAALPRKPDQRRQRQRIFRQLRCDLSNAHLLLPGQRKIKINRQILFRGVADRPHHHRPRAPRASHLHNFKTFHIHGLRLRRTIPLLLRLHHHLVAGEQAIRAFRP